jgi:hypothetical protein
MKPNAIKKKTARAEAMAQIMSSNHKVLRSTATKKKKKKTWK